MPCLCMVSISVIRDDWAEDRQETDVRHMPPGLCQLSSKVFWRTPHHSAQPVSPVVSRPNTASEVCNNVPSGQVLRPFDWARGASHGMNSRLSSVAFSARKTADLAARMGNASVHPQGLLSPRQFDLHYRRCVSPKQRAEV